MKLKHFHLSLEEYYDKNCIMDYPIIKDIDYCNSCVKCDYYEDIIGSRCVNCGIIQLSKCNVTLTDDIIALILSSSFREKGILTLSKSIRRQLISNHAKEYMTIPIDNSDTYKLQECFRLKIFMGIDRPNIKHIVAEKYTTQNCITEYIYYINITTLPNGKIEMRLSRSIIGKQVSNMFGINTVKLILENRAKSLDINNDILINKITRNTYLDKKKSLSGDIWHLYTIMNAYNLEEFNKDNIIDESMKTYMYHKRFCEQFECNPKEIVDKDYIVKDYFESKQLTI